MSLYEHVVITRPDVSSNAVEEFVQNLASKIENMGGTVEGAEYWGLRNPVSYTHLTLPTKRIV